MNDYLMRFIDRWIGIPLCAFFHFLSLFSRLFPFGSKKKKTCKKILFIKLSELGSIILAYPLLKKIKEEYPKAKLFFLTFKVNRPVFEVLKIIPIENVLTIRTGSIFLIFYDALRIIFKVRKEEIDIVFDLEFFSRFTAIITYLTGAHKKVGFHRYKMEGLYRGSFFTHKIQYNPLLHISEVFLSFWQAIGCQEKKYPDLKEEILPAEVVLPKLPKPEYAEGFKEKWKELGIEINKYKVILIHPGDGKLKIREWPLKNFIILAKNLLEDQETLIVLIGDKEAQKKAQVLCRYVKSNRCINLVGKTSLKEVFSLFYFSKMLIASDCGLIHLGSLTLLKKITIFGPESPKIFGPKDRDSQVVYYNLPCSPCLSVFNHRRSVCKNRKCLEMVTPEYVYKLVKEQL